MYIKVKANFIMTLQQFETLITETESSTLDFKNELYDFQNDSNKVVTAKFIKDVISFSNTIRTNTSFIIFGIQEDDGKLILNGIKNKIDDAILQDKVKDKVIPRPSFSYSTVKYQEKQFGILEFPIQKYEMPIVPSVNDLKGLEAGKVYYRNGTANTEANAYDVIRINDWLKSLPPLTTNSSSLNEKISVCLKDLTKANKKLSEIITDLLEISKTHNLEELKQFCLDELQGLNSKDQDYPYRSQKVTFSWAKININPYSFLKPTVQIIKKEMEENDDFFEGKIVLPHPIVEIEGYLATVENEPEASIATLQTDTQTLLGEGKKYPMYIYLFPYNFINLYGNIRQKAIDILMKI